MQYVAGARLRQQRQAALAMAATFSGSGAFSLAPKGLLSGAPSAGSNAASTAAEKGIRAAAEEAWRLSAKVNSDLFTLTYGALVAQLWRDSEDGAAVNGQLDRIGYGIGVRLVDDFLARMAAAAAALPGAQIVGPRERCTDFRETALMITSGAFRIFLNIIPTISAWSSDGREFVLSIPLEGSPLGAASTGGLAAGDGDGLGSELVELPARAVETRLHYASMYCGIIRGALEMVQLQVECTIVSDPLLHPPLPTERAHGASTDIRVRLIRHLEEESVLSH